jgi:hypothetical protein
MNKGGIVFLASIGFLAASACSSGSHTPVGDAGGPTATCGSTLTVEDESEKDCTTCTTGGTCSTQTPIKACCTYAGQPTTPLVRTTGEHRFSAPSGASGTPDLSCLSSPGTLGTPQTVTLTGYVWLFDTGSDSAGVQVQVFAENHPDTPDGTFSSTPLGTYTTKSTDPADPVDTTWNSNCPNGCSYRQYTISGIPTETPLVIETSDATGGATWATLYDYNIYFPNMAVENEGGTPTVHYDATAASSGDPNTVAGSLGYTVTSGVIAGEVHDCWTDPDGYVAGIRVSGATVGSSVLPEGNQIFYSNSSESSPLLVQSATSTTPLGLYGGVNYPTGVPIRITAVGEDPANPGKFLMLGTYVVQTFPSAVTALSLRGRRPWQL